MHEMEQAIDQFINQSINQSFDKSIFQAIHEIVSRNSQGKSDTQKNNSSYVNSRVWLICLAIVHRYSTLTNFTKTRTDKTHAQAHTNKDERSMTSSVPVDEGNKGEK